MKSVTLAIVALALMGFATPAAAHVVEVTTSVSIADVQDRAQLSDAIKSAVDNVLADTIAFKPTLVALTNARLIGERLYMRLLIADEQGEQDLESFIREKIDPRPEDDDHDLVT